MFSLAFTPILVPMSRGILASVSAKLTDEALALTDEQIHDIWVQAYEGQEFIFVLDPGVMPAIPERTRVERRPMCRSLSIDDPAHCMPSPPSTISTGDGRAGHDR